MELNILSVTAHAVTLSAETMEDRIDTAVNAHLLPVVRELVAAGGWVGYEVVPHRNRHEHDGPADDSREVMCDMAWPIARRLASIESGNYHPADGPETQRYAAALVAALAAGLTIELVMVRERDGIVTNQPRIKLAISSDGCRGAVIDKTSV